MTIIEHSPAKDEVLDFINDAVAQIQENGTEARFILMGGAAYEALRHAVAERFHRKPGNFETYNYLPIVVDPFRDASVCVVPSPVECARGVKGYRVDG